jgi:hypothetical protein
MMLAVSVPALRVSILSVHAENITLSAPLAESMILSAPPTNITHKHVGTAR